MGHGHGHGGGSGHGHAGAGTDRRRLATALGVTLITAVLGAAGAVYTGSLALLADLGHLLTDAGALVAALIASVRRRLRERLRRLARSQLPPLLDLDRSVARAPTLCLRRTCTCSSGSAASTRIFLAASEGGEKV